MENTTRPPERNASLSVKFDDRQEPNWTAEKTQYADCWFVWIHGGNAGDDNIHTAFIKMPPSKYLTVPSKLVMMSPAAFAELSHFSEIGRAITEAEK